MRAEFSKRSQIIAWGAVATAAWGHAIFSIMSPGGFPKFEAPAAYAHVKAADAPRTAFAAHAPGAKPQMTVAHFKAQVEKYSKDNMMVVLLRRHECGVCEGVSSSLNGARDWLMKKTRHGFAVYELNADDHPDVAALLRQKDPEAQARLHVFYNNEKIYESLGITDNQLHLAEILEMVQALAVGEVSVYDKYQPADVFPPKTGLNP